MPALLPLAAPLCTVCLFPDLVGDSMIDVIVWIRGDGSVVRKAFFNDTDCPGDPGE
jgi:hypothetical protein